MSSTRRAPSNDVITRQIEEYYDEHGETPSARYLRAANGRYGSLSTYSAELALWKKSEGTEPSVCNCWAGDPETIGVSGEDAEASVYAVADQSEDAAKRRRQGRPKKVGLAGNRSFEELFAEMVTLEEGPENQSNNRDADVGSKASTSGDELDAGLLSYIAANAIAIVDFDEHGDEDLEPTIPPLVEDERKEREAVERQLSKDAAWAEHRKNAAEAAPPPGGSFSGQNLFDELLVHQAGRTGAEGAASSTGMTAPTAPGTSSNSRSE